MEEERRGKNVYSCRYCKYLSTYCCVRCHQLIAHLKALPYLDTRILSLMSGVINLIWVCTVFIPYMLRDEYPTGFLAVIVFGSPYEYIIGPVTALGLCEIVSAITNTYRGRFWCSIWSLAWWGWITAMAFIADFNTTAGYMFLTITLFRSWTFISLDHTHPDGQHYGGRQLALRE